MTLHGKLWRGQAQPRRTPIRATPPSASTPHPTVARGFALALRSQAWPEQPQAGLGRCVASGPLLLELFGIAVNHTTIRTFGKTPALVIERFDRLWTEDGRLLRLPQEDCCQALSVPPGRKYQSDGGPGIVKILDLLKGSDDPEQDRVTVLKAQLLFWLIAATDGHAKNFSIFLGPRGTYRLTPLYDVLSAQPSLDARQVERKKMKLAMAVGASPHYRIDMIQARHFFETGSAAGLSRATVRTVIEEVSAAAGRAIKRLQEELPPRFPQWIHDSISKAVARRLATLSAGA